MISAVGMRGFVGILPSTTYFLPRRLLDSQVLALKYQESCGSISYHEDFSITSKEDRKKHFGQYDHVRVYGKDYFDRLRAVGFKVQEIDYSKTLSEDSIIKYCLVKGEILPVCTK